MAACLDKGGLNAYNTSKSESVGKDYRKQMAFYAMIEISQQVE